MKTTLFVLFSFLAIGVGAQEKDSVKTPVQEQTFTFADEMPQFPGGDQKMYEFISQNTVYPDSAKKHGIEGRVVVRFIVKKDGSISDPQIMKSASHGLNEEAIRVVKLMPKWTPGKQNGKPVSVYFMLPIQFKLD